MLKQLGIVVFTTTFWAAALAGAATAREAGSTPGVWGPAATASTDLSAQKAKRARKPAARRIAAAPVVAPAPYHQQCFLFFCNGGRPFHWLVLGVAY